VVLLSGGLDSTTVLAVARHEGYEVYALTFDYGQKHGIEIACAREAALRFAVAEHRVLCLDLASIAKSSLTGTGEIPKAGETPAAIPSTYVPARNLIFLSMACAWAESLGASDIFLGVSCVDYSGYPDCRPVFLNVAESVMNLATRAGVEGTAFKIHAPFLHMTKADIIRTGLKLGVDYGATHTCYDPAPDGKPCGLCDSCRLRRKAFLEVGVPDPLGT
jgi:7-cyano-7-deazaguanine synthase